MDIKLIISDIDGTILPMGGQISPATISAVQECRARGTEFVIASGRWYPAALKVVGDMLGIHDGYMIICNGGAVVRCDGSVLQEYVMNPEQARRVYEILHNEKVMMTSYVRGAIYRMRSHYLKSFRLPEVGGFFGGDRYDIVDEDEQAFLQKGLNRPYKMEAYSDDHALLARLRERLQAEGLQVNSSFPFNLEIMAPEAGKGVCVRWLTDYMGLQREQVMGFGDYTNDLTMLANVGWPVAVDNALDQVKAACRMVVPACADDGVAQAIRKYVLGGEQP